MKHVLLIFSALIFFVRGAAAQDLPTPADVARLDAAESAMFDAFGQADEKTFQQLAGEDYYTINADGVALDRAGALKLLPKFKGSTNARSEQHRRIYGSTAVLTGRAKFYFKALLVAEIHYTQVWVWREGRWQFVNWQGTMTGLPTWYPVIATSVLFLVIIGLARFMGRRKRRAASPAGLGIKG
jgi:hypothetical protein